MNKVLYVKNFLNADECNQLNNWVKEGIQNKWLDAGVSENSGWNLKNRLTTRNYPNRFEYSKTVYSVFDRITDLLAVKHLRKSVHGGGKNGVVVSCIYPGGNVHLHTDPLENNKEVLRCNVMTQAPDDGGELFINDEKINIGVGDLHCYLPSCNPHYVTTVKGNTPRIMWMFGYQCSLDEFEQIRQNLKN